MVSPLRSAAQDGKLTGIDPGAVSALLDALMAEEWVVFAKPRLEHTASLIGHLARYTHRIALSNARILGRDGDRVHLRPVVSRPRYSPPWLAEWTFSLLLGAYHQVRKDRAPGLSGVTAKDHAENLMENLEDLHQRLKSQTYVASKIKRVWIDKDGGLLRLIGKWLNAGVVEGDVISYSDKGTPQGGVISPVMANIYLHEVLDGWFVNEVKPRMKGYCFIVRFADDFIIGCQYDEDARRIMEVLPKRFDRYGLSIHPEKTKLIAFGRPVFGKTTGKEEATFDFLDFTHYWARSRKGNWVIKRKTASKKVKKAIVSMRTWCQNNRHKPLWWQHRILSSQLRRHLQYFAVRCNMRAMEAVLHYVTRGWKYWLSRRSHKSAIPWEAFRKFLEAYPLPTPRIVHNV